ncbi:MAG: DUF6268 family outer membrane beta-barrel protein [Chitinivibrionales bacterium]|nr:DUF6268 family outer membrane beta-barrel protein [Chitinivibrionales bacterium]
MLNYFALILFLSASSIYCFDNHDPSDDLATAAFELNQEAASGAAKIKAGRTFNFWQINSLLPGIKFGAIETFTGFEIDGLDRNFNGLNSNPLQRYGLVLGATPYKVGKQSGLLMVDGGLNTDFSRLNKNHVFANLTFEHLVDWSPKLSFGFGILLQEYFNAVNPYPVVDLNWEMQPHTKLKISWDEINVKHFFLAGLSFFMGFKYNQYYYALHQDYKYDSQNIAGQVGGEYMFIPNIYLRASYREIIWNSETLTLPDNSVFKNSLAQGRSIRISVVYGM